MLTLDSYRSFKYTSAKFMVDHIEKNGKPPSAIIIDAPRDEETKFLHEVYGVLEELNNGRLFASFQGKIIQERTRRGIPIIVLSNAPPVLRALSEDRWDIKALFRTVDGKDVYVQNARVSSNVKDVKNNSISWQNVVETIPYEKEGDTLSDKLLFDMYTDNFLQMEKLKEENVDEYYAIIPGVVKKWGPINTAPNHKAPEYILYQAQKQSKNFEK